MIIPDQEIGRAALQIPIHLTAYHKKDFPDLAVAITSLAEMPHIVIAKDAWQIATKQERRAMIWHERQHILLGHPYRKADIGARRLEREVVWSSPDWVNVTLARLMFLVQVKRKYKHATRRSILKAFESGHIFWCTHCGRKDEMHVKLASDYMVALRADGQIFLAWSKRDGQWWKPSTRAWGAVRSEAYLRNMLAGTKAHRRYKRT